MTDVTQLIRDLRAAKSWTVAQFAAAIGSKSPGYASAIERGGPCSVRIALRIEELSEGKIPARLLHPDIGLVERARGIFPAGEGDQLNFPIPAYAAPGTPTP